MANENPVDISGAITTLTDAISKIGQVQVELLDTAIKSVTSTLASLAPALGDVANNVTGAANKLLQDVSASFTAKQ